MSACIQINNQPHSAEIDRIKSRGSTSSISMGEELTTSSNNSGSVADNQHHSLIHSNISHAEISYNIIPMLEDDKEVTLKTVPKFLDEGNDFFRYIDPEPVLSPSYASINPNKRIRFPIYEHIEKCSSKEAPPTYSPAVEEVTVISMKAEWLSPYEPATTRNWRNFIMEINSTQLNFYRIDESLTAGIKNYTNGDSKEGNGSHHSHFLSLPAKNAHQFNKADQERICFNLKRNRNKYLTNDRIIKSYSLQCAKLGIPTDYTKKTFVLRMRCEAEQFLLNFSHVDDMIMWTMYLQMGICVSLDLDLREYPTYRVVPRRRRRRRRRNGENSDAHGRSNSIGRLQLTRISSFSSSNESKPPSRMKPSRSLSSGLLSLYNRSQSSKAISELPSESKSSSVPSSRKNSATDETVSTDFKSKLKCLFRSKSNNRAGASSRKVTVEKFKNQTRELNCVMEDEEEDTSANVVRTMSLPAKEQSCMISKVITLPAELNQNSILKEKSGELTVPANNPKNFTDPSHAIPLPVTVEEECPLSNNASADIDFPIEHRNNALVQRELEEFREVVREHNEAAEENLCDATDELLMMRDCSGDDDEEEEDDDEDTHVVNDSFDQSRSVYIDEGIFHDSDDDYVYTMERRNSYRNRASSTTSALSNTPYGSDEVKWCPPIKHMSRRRYIRDSLRCIKPLSEGHRWIGKVVFRPTRAPNFETNNLPITIGNYSLGISSTQRKTGNKNSWKDLDYKQTKNHYLKIFTVGPVGYLRAGTKIFDSWNKDF